VVVGSERDAVVVAWPGFTAASRVGIVAMVRAARGLDSPEHVYSGGTVAGTALPRSSSGIAECTALGERNELIYLFLYHTRLRCGETKRLRVRNFDFKAKNPQGQTVPLIRLTDKATKTRVGGVIPLHKSLVEPLEELCSTLRPSDAPFPVLPGMKAWKLDLKAAGIAFEVDGLRFDRHAIRMVKTTHLMQQGEQPESIARGGRHALSVMLGDYVDWSKVVPIGDGGDGMPFGTVASGNDTVRFVEGNMHPAEEVS
jgi:integrase